ncbi:MAG: carboxymuconolactone decarboxylase family protein [Bdellovibrionota bacterium]
MSFESFRESIGDFARDVRVNLSSVLSEEGAPGLSTAQVWGVALSCAYATKDKALFSAVEEIALNPESPKISQIELAACKTAASLMAMNNVYYRFSHLLEDSEFSSMPARLRMQGIANHGVDKILFEMMCLAVSAMSGCGMCIKSHVAQLKKAGVSNEAIQSSVRIASVVNSASTAASI